MSLFCNVHISLPNTVQYTPGKHFNYALFELKAEGSTYKIFFLLNASFPNAM